MDQALLVNEQISAGAELARYFSQQYPLDIAFWMREGEDGNWNLYLISQTINDSNLRAAYGEMHRILSGHSNLWLDPFQVRIADLNLPLSQGMIALKNRFPANLVTRIRNRMVSGTFVEEAVLYPSNFVVRATL